MATVLPPIPTSPSQTGLSVTGKGASSKEFSRSPPAVPPSLAASSSSRSNGPAAGETHGLDGWTDPKAKEFYERGKAKEHKMFYSQSECGDVCGHEPECMCTICICGNHRCPEPLRHVPYGELESEYRKKYPGWDAFPRRHKGKPSAAFKPTPVPGMYDRKAAQAAEAAPRMRPLPDQRRPQLPFEGQTEYKDTFVPKQPDERWPRMKDHPMEPIGFDATTEQRAMYDGTPGNPAKPHKTGETPFEEGKFQGDSEYDDRYKGAKGDARRRGPNQAKKWEKGAPRDLRSQYRDEYTGDRGLLCPARLLPQKKPGLDAHMHYKFTGQYNRIGDPMYVQ